MKSTRNNYDHMLSDAQRRFTTYDMLALACRPGVEDKGAYLCTCFLGETVLAEKTTGRMTVGGKSSDFGETLSILDWLCDAASNAAAAGEYCTVGSLPGVYVGGSNLVISCNTLAKQIQERPEAFREACLSMGGREMRLGDMGFCVPVFANVDVCLKFYFADEEFPPQLTLLWDRNMLQFVRYETVYYIAGCLQKRLRDLMDV